MKPTVVISLDFELAWGSFDVEPTEALLESATWTHDVGAPLLLGLLERHRLPATWATVGALMHDGLTEDALAMDEVQTPWFPYPWLSLVPRGRGEAEARAWFAPSLVERIRRAETPQEIGFHGYTHASFGHPGTSRARAAQELAACRRTSDALGLDAVSFVYPRNQVGHLDLLAPHGFRTWRAPDAQAWEALSRRLPRGRNLAGVAADFLGSAPLTTRPSVEGGLVAQPGSVMVRYAQGWRGAIPDTTRARRLRAGLDAVIARGGTFHVWLHPINLHARHPRLADVLDGFFGAVRAEVDRGRVRVATMRQIANELLPETRGSTQ